MTSNTSTHAPHIVRLDVLRAVACLTVFFFHFCDMISQWRVGWNGSICSYAGWSTLGLVFVPLMWGWLGVALFFVISGFCIHLSFLKLAGSFSFGPYIRRRFFRIYPAYLMCLVVCLLLAPWLPTRYLNFWQVVTHLFMVHNLFKVTFTGINWVMWSLGVEWQFYLLFPLLLWGRTRIGMSGCLVGALILNLICQVYLSLAHGLPGRPISPAWSFPLVTWCDWILGACLAEAFVRKQPLFPHNMPVLIGSLLLLVVALNFQPLCMQSYLISSVFFAALMERYLVVLTPLNWLERALVPVGFVSYSLYLWHQVIIRLAMVIGEALGLAFTPVTEWLAYLPVIIVVTGFVSVVSYYWIERGVPRWLYHTKTTEPSLLARDAPIHPPSPTPPGDP